MLNCIRHMMHRLHVIPSQRLKSAPVKHSGSNHTSTAAFKDWAIDPTGLPYDIRSHIYFCHILLVLRLSFDDVFKNGSNWFIQFYDHIEARRAVTHFNSQSPPPNPRIALLCCLSSEGPIDNHMQMLTSHFWIRRRVIFFTRWSSPSKKRDGGN